MKDLNAASLTDVHEWFDTYYGPNNATLVIAGDVDTQTALAKAKHYVGGIEPGPPVKRQVTWMAKREGSHRQVIQDRVPQARIYKVWNVPEVTDPAAQHLTLFADILANGKNSRLYRHLVYEQSEQEHPDITGPLGDIRSGARRRWSDRELRPERQLLGRLSGTAAGDGCTRRRPRSQIIHFIPRA
jgi:hypothetical protein